MSAHRELNRIDDAYLQLAGPGSPMNIDSEGRTQKRRGSTIEMKKVSSTFRSDSVKGGTGKKWALVIEPAHSSNEEIRVLPSTSPTPVPSDDDRHVISANLSIHSRTLAGKLCTGVDAGLSWQHPQNNPHP
ncbi:uncharacterized protein BJ212DRAFT_1297026 [Suillus subaureus]|uniref:Uncharacterized protein n=1 Tax=Suillus subaureus TaxID=48587 RepID=A0A9P7EHN3_9AGAM|nr:uncharacterized protein BJ212DRAFT_1297026 [Suillus subaureus]KAG1821684.1 hypothetical protein BJ212DRAFT_1297026 [Suillus subaureus]